MKKCPFCSAELLEEAEFCFYCMSPLKEKVPVSASRRKMPVRKLIISCVAFIMAVIIGFVAVNGGFKFGNNSVAPIVDTPNDTDNTTTDLQPPFVQDEVVSDNKKPAVDSTSSSDTPSGEETVTDSDGDTDSKTEAPDNVQNETYLNFRFVENSTGYTVYGINGNNASTKAIIPDTYNGKPVTEIGAEAFFHNRELRAVHIPKTVKKIGDNAFIGCTNLSELEIPEGVEEIGFSAFANIAVEHLVIPSTVKVLTMSFSGDSFKTVTMKCIPDLMYNVFEFCTKLEKVYLPDELKVIESGMFKDCHSLKSVSFVFGLTSIRIESFKNCFGLERIEFDTEILEFAAFENCKNLKTVNFAATMKKIDGYVFSGCSNLADIYYGGTKADWNKIDKDADWDKNLDTNEIFNNYTIHCSDGDITV